MKKFIDHLSTFVLWATLVIFVVIGGLAGYAAGDELLSSTEFIRPKDIVQCRIGLPLFGILVLGFCGFFIADYLSNLVLKLNNLFKPK